MKLWKEFKAFSVKGNLFELAIGIMIGAAFNSIVQSLVKDILNPVIGIFVQKSSLGEWALKFTVDAPAGEKIVEIKYGAFLQASLDFIIMAFIVFMIAKGIKRLKEKAEDPKDTTVPTPKDIQLLTEIRDNLANLGSRKDT